MNREAEPCYTMGKTQPTGLYLQAVGIICNALENNETQIERCIQMAFEYEEENQNLIEQLNQLEENFLLQDELQDDSFLITLDTYREKKSQKKALKLMIEKVNKNLQ